MSEVDGATIEALVRDHGAYVRDAVRGLGVTGADVADVSQEVWVVVVRRLHAFEGRSALRTWLYGICRRVCSDHFRRAHRRYERPTEAPPERGTAPEQHRRLEALQRLRALRVAGAELPADRLEVVASFALGTATAAQLASRHRCADKTIFSRLYATREHLRRALRRAGYGFALALTLPRRAAAMARGSGLWLPGGLLSGAVAAVAAVALLLPPPALGLSLAVASTDAAVRRVAFTALAPSHPPPPRAAHAALRTVPALTPAPAPPSSTVTSSSVEFTVWDVMEPAARLRLRQVAFMEFVPHY